MTELVTIHLGRAAYEPTLRLQRRLWEKVQAAEDELAYLVLVEHDPPVITLGRGADRSNILVSAEQLAAAGAEVHETSRGGDVTYHGPGQLVGYPIVLIRALGTFHITAGRRQGLTGVWVADEKVAAIGIAIRRWVSYHGFALNVSPDLSHFEWIVPCGIADKGVTSMTRLLGRPVEVGEVIPTLVQCAVDVFGFDAARTGSMDEIDV